MTRLLNIGRNIWPIAKFVLTTLIYLLLLKMGVHPFWGLLLILYRKAVFRIILILAAFYLLTAPLLS